MRDRERMDGKVEGSRGYRQLRRRVCAGKFPDCSQVGSLVRLAWLLGRMGLKGADRREPARDTHAFSGCGSGGT